MIYLRISHKGKRTFIPIGIKIHPKHWNENTDSVRKSYKQYKAISSTLARIDEACTDIRFELAREGKAATAERLKRLVLSRITEEEDTQNFIEYARDFIQGYYDKDKISTWKRMRVVVNKLEKFRPGLEFDEITPEFIRRYQTHLKKRYNNNINTSSKNISGIRTILYAAIREGVFPQEKNPFFQVSLPTKPGVKVHLKPWEIEAMNKTGLTEGEGPYKARDYFMCAFYLFGVRFADIALMKWEHVIEEKGKRRLAWVMGKVDREHSILITKPAWEIMSKYKGQWEYIFPILHGYDIANAEKERKAIESRNSRINQDLEKVRERADIKTHISFHISRHSIAGHLKREGWGIHDISKAMGHKSVAQTEEYFRGFDFGDLDDKMSELWG